MLFGAWCAGCAAITRRLTPVGARVPLRSRGGAACPDCGAQCALAVGGCGSRGSRRRRAPPR
eukprot:6904323-Prymnesium_polylepis.1